MAENVGSRKHAVEFLWHSIPRRWRESIPHPTSSSPLPNKPAWTGNNGVAWVFKHLGWKKGMQDDGTMSLLLPTRLTVRQATSALTRDITKCRTSALQRYIVRHALAKSPTLPTSSLSAPMLRKREKPYQPAARSCTPPLPPPPQRNHPLSEPPNQLSPSPPGFR